MNKPPLSLFFLFLFGIVAFLRAAPIHNQEKNFSEEGAVIIQKMEYPMQHNYYLYLPKHLDPDRTYWLVCYVHGARGSGRDDLLTLQHFVTRGDCIAVAPTFTNGYQLLKNKTDEQLMAILCQLSKKYKIHEQIFIFGHSAGGQYAHRFMLKHPDLVIGCEACSSGTWATGSVYHSLTPVAKDIPIAIACGEEDKKKIGDVMERLAFRDSPTPHPTRENPGWNRIEWFKKFSLQLQKEDFFFKSKIFPGEIHQVDEGEQELLALEAFFLGVSGMLPEERATYDNRIATIKKNIANKKFDLVQSEIEQLQQKVDSRSKEVLKKTFFMKGWNTSETALDQCLQSAKSFVEEEIVLLQKKAKLSNVN